MFKPRTQWHCGTCSQCIDRRFAITAAGLARYDSETDYVSDVFTGPRKEGPEKNMAIDYTRHGIELSQRTESQLAILFSTELSRAVRFEPKRSEAAHRIISTHKRHGKTVERVLKEQVAERSEDLVNHTLVPSSLLALAIGTDYPAKPGQLPSKGGTTDLGALLDRTVRTKLAEEIGDRVIERIGGSAKKTGNQRPKKPDRRDTIVFAAIALGLKGEKYCAFLQERGLRPKWFDSGATGYTRSYELGGEHGKRKFKMRSREPAPE